MPSSAASNRGISLVELIVFIVVVSLAVTGVMTLYVTATRQSADPMLRIRSVELAQAYLEEALLKAYDENTPVGGGCVFITIRKRRSE